MKRGDKLCAAPWGMAMGGPWGPCPVAGKGRGLPHPIQAMLRLNMKEGISVYAIDKAREDGTKKQWEVRWTVDVEQEEGRGKRKKKERGLKRLRTKGTKAKGRGTSGSNVVSTDKEN